MLTNIPVFLIAIFHPSKTQETLATVGIQYKVTSLSVREMIKFCAESQKDILIPSLETLLSRYFSVNISCVNDEDFWVGTPLLPDDAAFIEDSLKNYCNDKSSELVDWNQIFENLKKNNNSTTIKSPKELHAWIFPTIFSVYKS